MPGNIKRLRTPECMLKNSNAKLKKPRLLSLQLKKLVKRKRESESSKKISRENVKKLLKPLRTLREKELRLKKLKWNVRDSKKNSALPTNKSKKD